MVSIANNSTLLPFQAIYQGKTTYWSNQQTIKISSKIFSHLILIKSELNQGYHTCKGVWQIDVWSVHRSEEFRNWMQTNFNNIILNYVPGGCTSLHQPCNVGIQRPFKHSIKCSYHESVIMDMLEKIEKDSPVLTINKSIGTLCNHSVTWLWNAFYAINKPDLIKKVIIFCGCNE